MTVASLDRRALALWAVFAIGPLLAGAQTSRLPSPVEPAGDDSGLLIELESELDTTIQSELAAPQAGPTSPSSSPATETAAQPESLEELWAMALAGNPSLDAQRQQVQAAEHRVEVERSARYPQLGVNAGYIVRDNEPSYLVDFNDLPPPINQFSGRLATDQREGFVGLARAEMPIFTAGSIGHRVDAARAEVRASGQDLRRDVQDLKLAIATRYTEVLRAQWDVDVATAQQVNLEAHRNRIELLVEHERALRNDLLAAEVSLANARQMRVRAEHRLDVARSNLNRLVQRPLESPVRLAELSLPSLSLDLQSLQQQAVERRSDVAALTERIRSYQEKAKAIRAEGKPQVELGVQYAYQENRFRDPQALSSATLGVEWTPLDGGRRRHEAAAWLAKSTSLARLRDDTIQRIHAQVRNAALGVQEATRRVELLRCTLVHAEENLRLAEQRYAAGAGTNTEVLDAVAHRSHTIRGFHSARYDAALSSYRLGHALGKL